MSDLLGAIASALTHPSAQPIYIKNQQHQWLFVNDAGAKLIGLSPDTIVGRSEADFLPQQLAQKLYKQDSAFFAQQSERSRVANAEVSRAEVSQAEVSQAEVPRAEATTAESIITGSIEAEPTESATLTFDQSRQFVGHRQLTQIQGQPALINTLQDVTELAVAQQRNAALTEKLEANQAELANALRLESTLKRITDRVRDSLDETNILQSAVEELVKTLNVKSANTALYDLEQETSTVRYEYSDGLPSIRGKVAQLEAYSEVYHPLLAGQYLQFCSIKPSPIRGHVSMFAAPIRDDGGVLGDLWLINDASAYLTEIDIRLVQQVTNQCAIAIRQARLYQESQSQVRELERVNNLKDDFLSTVSHELRTPVTSMRVALQLLGVTLNQEHDLDAELAKPQLQQGRIARYYRILKEECEREISLINDLLDLQRLDVGNHPMALQPVDLPNWLPNLVNGFKPRAKSRELNISVDVPNDLPEFVSDLASIERVLVELVNNACKYTPPQHSIHIGVLPGHQDNILFRVVNTGVEIAAAERELIFDKFYRVPSADPWKQGGTGLGLALAQKLVGHMQGTIEVESGNNQTAFIVDLPLTISEK